MVKKSSSKSKSSSMANAKEEKDSSEPSINYDNDEKVHEESKPQISEPITESAEISKLEQPDSTVIANGASPSMDGKRSDEEEKEEKEENEKEEEPEEKWDLTHILTTEEINSSNPKMCMTKRCPLLACCKYVSSLDTSNIWFCCVDCQEKDYGGWPDCEELPIQTMLSDHRAAIIEKCSGRYSPDMPIFPNDSIDEGNESCTDLNTDIGQVVATVTPPPNKVSKSLDIKLGEGREILKQSTVSPSPAVTGPSKQAFAIHQKWLETAKALGGEKLVVSKDAAKKLIFDVLHDAFRPMNITDLFNALKGVVPSPVLKSCLDEMSCMNHKVQFYDDSDDESEKEKTKESKRRLTESSSEPLNQETFSSSICVKEGRNASVTLYYVDQSKLFNNGDGFLPDYRNTLITNHEQAKAELDHLNQQLSQTLAQTTVLLAQPTNVDADIKLHENESFVQKLTEQLNASQEYRCNEKSRKQIMKRIEAMTAIWRNRKRLTLDFLTMMEEITDGTISIKKSLAGDGPLDIDSDEAVLKAAKLFASKKRSHGSMYSLNRLPSTNGKKLKESVGSESFIGVMLCPRGFVTRVFDQD